MLWTILLALLILWALGFGFGVVGNLIHILHGTGLAINMKGARYETL